MLSPTLTFVASSGFYVLSTPCSPCYLLGLFHPSSVLGVNPSRPYPPNVVVRFLKRRNLLGVKISVKIIPSFKVQLHIEVCTKVLVLTRYLCHCLRAFTLQGFLALVIAINYIPPFMCFFDPIMLIIDHRHSKETSPKRSQAFSSLTDPFGFFHLLLSLNSLAF